MGTGCDDSDWLTELVAGISQRLVLDQNHLPQRKLATDEIGQVPIRQVAFAPAHIPSEVSVLSLKEWTNQHDFRRWSSESQRHETLLPFR